MVTAELPFVVDSDISAADRWFSVLDQRGFIVDRRRWTAQVVGVHVAECDTWIQLEFAEDQRRSLLVRLASGTGVGAAVETVHATLLRLLQLAQL
jgi:hypothetical protein